jgi:prevent-host-death family protein
MRTVNMHDAKSNLSRLVESVQNGLEDGVIIARNGKPAARLVPVEAKASRVTRRIGAGKDILAGAYIPQTVEGFNESDAEIAAMFDESARKGLNP